MNKKAKYLKYKMKVISCYAVVKSFNINNAQVLIKKQNKEAEEKCSSQLKTTSIWETRAHWSDATNILLVIIK